MQRFAQAHVADEAYLGGNIRQSGLAMLL